METASPPDLAPIKAQLRDLFGRTAYSHKTHVIQAGMTARRNSIIKTAEIVLSAISTTGLIAACFGTGQWALIIGAASSTMLLALIFYTKDFDLGKVAEQHKRTSDELWHIREKYLDLLTDVQTGEIEFEKLIRKRDALREDLNSVYNAAHITSPEAYAAAQQALKLNEDLTFTDEEIDVLLPPPLRVTKKA